jgi:hypothetical protein
MSVLIVGADGSMGKRYQAILSYLGVDYFCVDKKDSLKTINFYAEEASGIIISTPTDTHADYIRRFLRYEKPILCEKPITKSIKELRRLISDIEHSHTPFKMMLQYETLIDKKKRGNSKYNYFRHGTDGLVWDCIQIIGLAQGDVTLEESSPIWSCTLNGQKLNLSDMDYAYLHFVQTWFKKPREDLSKLFDIHQKTSEYGNVWH